MEVKLICIKNYKGFKVGDIIYSEYYIITCNEVWEYVPIYSLDKNITDIILFENFSEYFCTISELRKKKLEKLIK